MIHPYMIWSTPKPKAQKYNPYLVKYIFINPKTISKIPTTLISLKVYLLAFTKAGDKAFRDHIEGLEKMINGVK